MGSETVDTLVVGAGISGLAYAHGRGAELDGLVLEASERPGGLVRTVTEEGFRCEHGPEAMPGAARAARELALALDIALHEVPVSARRRYLLLGGRLVEVPSAPEDLATSPLLSIGGKMRLMAEPACDARQALDGSIADFARHRMGSEALERLVDPLVAGLHAGDPEQLSLRACFPQVARWVEAHGSLYGAFKARMRAPRASHAFQGGLGGGVSLGTLWRPRNGMQALTDALARALGPRLRVGTRVVSVERRGAGAGFCVELEGGALVDARRLVLALPLAAARRLLAGSAPELSQALESMQAENLVSIAHAYRRADVGHDLDAFGYLVPKSAGGAVLGTLFSSTLDPECAPPGHVLLRSLVGGARAPASASLSDEALLALVAAECARPLDLRRSPVFTRIARWERSIPRYDLEHPARQRALEEKLPPDLSLLGNYQRGLDLGTLVDRAQELARRHAAERAS